MYGSIKLKLKPVSRALPERISNLLEVVNEYYDVPTLTHVGVGPRDETLLAFSNEPLLLNVVGAMRDDLARNTLAPLILFIVEDPEEMYAAHRLGEALLKSAGVDDVDDLDGEQLSEFFRVTEACFNVDENSLFMDERGSLWNIDDKGYLTIKAGSTLL